MKRETPPTRSPTKAAPTSPATSRPRVAQLRREASKLQIITLAQAMERQPSTSEEDIRGEAAAAVLASTMKAASRCKRADTTPLAESTGSTEVVNTEEESTEVVLVSTNPPEHIITTIPSPTTTKSPSLTKRKIKRRKPQKTKERPSPLSRKP